MSFLRPGIRRILRLRATDAGARRRGTDQSDVDEEIQHHIDLRAEQLMREGLPADVAGREARRLFGEDPQILAALYASADDRNRHMQLRERWAALVQDTRYAARRIVREPVTTAFVIGTLALGVGANLAAFSLIDHLLLTASPHIREPERVVRVYRRTISPSAGTQTAPWLPFATFQSLRADMRTARGVEAYRIDEAMVGDRTSSYLRRVGRVSAGVFDLLGTRPLAGRFPSKAEDGVNGAATVVLSERLWRSEYAGDPGALGKVLMVRGVPRTIVGIAPADFTGPQLGRVDVWTLIDEKSAASQNWFVVARLEGGVAMATASADADAAHLRSGTTQPAWIRNATLLVAPMRYDDTARESAEAVMARWLGFVAGLILLIACANIVNLMLARMIRRRRELAIRVALGSGRARVARLIMLEGMLLALGGAVASLGITAAIEPIVRRAVFPGAGWTFALFHPRALVVLAILAIIIGVLVGVIPAIQAGSSELSKALQSGDRVARGRSRTRAILTVTQAALSVVLLVGAGLFLRSLSRIRSVDLGLQPDRVITVVASYPPATPKTMQEYASAERERARRLADAVRRVPGVASASVSVGLPLGRGSRLVCFGSDMACGDAGVAVGVSTRTADSIPSLAGGGPYITAVGDDYFETVGTRILTGRAFTTRDREGSERVVVVSASMARALWPNRPAIDECLRIGTPTAPCARVVGVAADVHRSGVHEEPSFAYYVPLGQEDGFSGTWLLVRPAASATTSWPALRTAMLAADPGVTALDMHLLAESLDTEMRPLRLGMATFVLGATLAVIVAALGLYSLMAYTVSWRTREIGVRIALGATSEKITADVVGAGAGLATTGIVVGLVCALAARPWVQLQLFQTSASDPFILGGAAVVMQLVALAACWVPARRAARVSPIEALRSE